MKLLAFAIIVLISWWPLQSTSQESPRYYDVYTSGQENYHTYRIPALLTTQKGTVLAFAEGRALKRGGDHSENDIVIKRSSDNGISWSPVEIVQEAGADNLNNPCVVQLENGRILMMFQIFPEKLHARAIPNQGVGVASPGVEGPDVQRTYTTYSDDEGLTWSDRKEVTSQVKKGKQIVAIATGPGLGIQLTRGQYKGRIIMPQNETWYDDPGTRKFNVYVVYSDDEGSTWQMGEVAPSNQEVEDQKGYGNELQVVELSDGSVLMNSRSNKGSNLRKQAVSLDGGQTWSDLRDHPQLPEPQCMGSILRYQFDGNDKKSILLYAGPANPSKRNQGTIWMSFDEGKTWPSSKILEPGFYAYSCLTKMQDGSIGLLFEADDHDTIKLAIFDLGWLSRD